MASHNQDPFEYHPESSGSANDDFEKVDAPGSGFDPDNFADSPNAAVTGSYDFGTNQDAEISTTTDNKGEVEAKEDHNYGIDASEAEAYNRKSEPLISFGDQDAYSGQVSSVQPSATVPDIEPILDFASSSAADILSSLKTSAPFSSSHNPDTFPTTSYSNEDFDDFESKKETKQVERNSEETTKGCWMKGVDPRVKDLIYWRDVKKTGVVFGTMLVVLISLAIFSLVSVTAYLSLAVLTVTFSFVVYKKILAAVQKSNDGHPFKPLLDLDITLSEDKLKSVIQAVLKNINATLRELRRLFLVEDAVDSIKFGLLLWALTYIGSWFNGMSIIIIDLILLFTVPKVYETYQVQIDNYVGLAKSQVNNVLTIVKSKLPFLKKKEKAQ